MKKIFVLASLAALIFSACSKEIDPMSSQEYGASPSHNGKYTFTIKATMDAEEDTKTSYAGDRTFSWSAGDQISLLFHSGETNKFFTLTNTSGAGTVATFSGEIEDGYEIGASNDGGKKVALFPAADHVYNTEKAEPVYFNVPALTDFTKSHFSANLPMAAIGDTDNHFAFKHISGSYKVVFTDIDASVSKVKLFVKNQNTKAISGLFHLYNDSYGHIYYWTDTSASEGSEVQTVSYITAVEGGKATFYIPYTHWSLTFLPEFTLTNADNGYILKTVKAKDQATFMGASDENRSQYNRMVVLPEIPASGTGAAPAWRSNHGINWDMVDTQAGGRTSANLAGINSMKVTSDESNVYILLDIKSSYLVDNSSYDYSNYFTLYAGDGSDTGKLEWMWTTKRQNYWTGWLKTANAIDFSGVDGTFVDSVASAGGDNTYYEITIPRAGNSALLGTTAYLGCVFNKCFYKDGAVQKDPDQADTWVGYSPAPWNPMFEVTLPEYAPPASAVTSPLELSFTEASGEVANPERGMMSYSVFRFAGDAIPAVQSIPVNYEGESLAFILFYMPDYMGKDLDSEALGFISAEFDKVRAANMKAIVRFAYDEEHVANSQHEATPTQVLRHVDQLSDVLTANADILYLVQAGWLGTYGEWYYKTKNNGETVADYDDYYLYTVSGSSVSDLNDNHKKLLDRVLAKVPSPVQVGLRTAFYKRYYLSPSAIGEWTPITSWGTSANDRLAFYNDGFRGDANDVGTFSSTTDREMWYSQGNYLACGGELSYKSEANYAALSSDLKDCDNAIAELRRQHWSYLHYSTSNLFMKAWYDAGRFEDIKKALGYRLVLNSADFTFPDLNSGSSVNYSISIQNKGCAPVVYERPFKLVLIRDGVATVLKESLMDVRNLAPGAAATVLSGSFTLPYRVAIGDKLAIWLPDSAPGLQSNPAYSILLACSDVTWEDGYNVLEVF